MRNQGGSLSGQVASANIWQIAGKFLGRIFDLLTLAVLSHLLTPADFGLTALAMSAIYITEAITQLPLGVVMLNVKQPPQEMYDTAFTLAFLRGLALAVLLGGVAVVMAEVYRDPRLVPLVLALALAPILRGLISPGMVLFMREMDFRQQTALEVAGKVVAFVVATSTAALTHSYWAIASATITAPLVMNALSYWFAPYTPRLGLSHWTSFRDFVGWNSVAQLFMALNWQMDRLLLGRLVPRTALGHFTMASDVANILNQAVLVPIGGPLLAAYARHNEERADLKQPYLKATNAIFALAAPLFLGLSLMSHQAVLIALGKGWSQSADILQWLALIALIPLPVWHFASLAIPLGQVRMFTWRAIGEFVVAMPALILGGIFFSIPGIIVARAISSLAILAISMLGVRRLIACSVAAQCWALRRTVVGLVVLAVVVISLRPLIGDTGFLSLLAGSAAVSAAGACAYVAALWVLWSAEGRPDGIEQIVRDMLVGLLASLRRS